jgi:ATP-binding cassette subfamily F protein 3
MGPNGSGKTTLLRVLLGQEEPDAGRVQVGHLVEFGYYDQHLALLPPEQSVIRAVWPEADPSTEEQGMRDLLARFGLTGDQVNQRVAELSGGEKSRAALARLVAQGCNVLVLDEPTNHLDLWACDALEEALREFEGTVIVVSHDRYFLNRVADLLVVLDGTGRAEVIHGNYDTYELMRTQQQVSGGREPSVAPAATARKERPASPPAAKTKRKRKFPYRKPDELETDIAAAETQLRELELLLASPDLYRDGDKVKETTRSFEETKLRLQQLYDHWEEALDLS